jgi:hypothetical protein
MDNSFNWVNVVGDEDKFGFVFFNKGGHVVETELDVVGLSGFACTSFLGGSLETEFLLLLSLGLVLR